MESAPVRPGKTLWAATACLLVALLALAVCRFGPKPWEGRTGKVLFGKDVARMTTGERWSGTVALYAHKGGEVVDKMGTEEWVALGLWVGSLATGGIFLVLGCSAPLWVRWSRRESEAEALPSGWSASRLSWFVFGCALAAAGVIRWPCLPSQILWDEQDNLRRNYHGYYEYTEPGQAPVWHAATLQDALWENERGNNPHLYSALAQVSNQAWRALSGAPRERYDIVALRLPAAICGWLAVAALWWALNAVGLGRLAPWAALLAAVHPLWSEYSIEARGYGITLLLAPLFLAWAWRFLQAGRWRDAAGLATASVGLLWSFPGSLYFVAALNATVFIILLGRWRADQAAARSGLARWVVANTMAAAVFLLAMGPVLPQTAAVMEGNFQKHQLTAFWFVLVHNLFTTGMQFHFPLDPYFNEDGSGPSALAWLFGGYWKIWPVALWSLVAVPALAGIGLSRWWNANRTWFWLAVGTVAGGALCCAHNAWVTGCFIYPWYLIYILPVLLAAMAGGLVAGTNRLGPGLATGPATALACLWMLAVSHPLARPNGWKADDWLAHPRPVGMVWPVHDGQIPRAEFLRGKALWVNYQDGYQIVIKGYADNPAVWASVLARPISERGQPISR